MRGLALLIFAACSSGSPAPSDPAPSPPPVARAPADPLARGRAIERSIKTGDAHRFRIEIPAGHCARGVVMQKGIDLLLIVYDPVGKKLGEFDSPNGESGPEPFTIEASAAGAYDLEVKSFGEDQAGSAAGSVVKPKEGRYEARLDALLSADEYAELRAKERFSSPRIRELWRAIRKNDAGAVERFWTELRGKAPIVEPYLDDPKTALVTFVFRATTRWVGLFGAIDFREKPMVRLGESDVWILTARVPSDSTLDYAFVTADNPPEHHVPFRKDGGPNPRWSKKQLDPNNPKVRIDLSRLELPGAPPQPYITAKPDVPKGKVVEIQVNSAQLKEKRRIGVYTPPDYDPKKTYPLVIAFDGEGYGLDPPQLIPLPTILDNMIAARKIPPLVAALVANQGTRERDLPGSPAFSAFIATELVPKLRVDYRAGMTAADTIVTGSSFGGLCSVYTAFQHSDVIGNALSNSGSFLFRKDSLGVDISDYVEGGWLTRDIATAPKRPVRLYLDAGRFEAELTSSNRHLRDVLIAKGYPVTYAEFSGGHDYWSWRGTISDGLVALFKR